MTKDRHAPHEQAPPTSVHPGRDGGREGNRDQGIVRDERGQEQPADKDRAQHDSTSE